MNFRKALSIMLTLFLAFSMFSANSEKSSWDCPKCGRTDNTGNYCGGCGHSAPWIWVCTECGRTCDTGNYCCDCGHPAPWIEAQTGNDSRQDTNKTVNTIAIGDIITFGNYEQDGNSGNGPEKIEWIVLDIDETNNKALLLSRYGLDAKPYNTESTAITWERSTIRKWLNDEFLKGAFGEKEQTAIMITAVDNSKSQGYFEAQGGLNTQDQIFLLSYAEANQYLNVTSSDRNNMKSRVSPTQYAITHGAFLSGNKTEDGASTGWWWLRSPGFYQTRAAYVNGAGSLYNGSVHYASGCVRPAFWLNLESVIF